MISAPRVTWLLNFIERRLPDRPEARGWDDLRGELERFVYGGDQQTDRGGVLVGTVLGASPTNDEIAAIREDVRRLVAGFVDLHVTREDLTRDRSGRPGKLTHDRSGTRAYLTHALVEKIIPGPPERAVASQPSLRVDATLTLVPLRWANRVAGVVAGTTWRDVVLTLAFITLYEQPVTPFRRCEDSTCQRLFVTMGKKRFCTIQHQMRVLMRDRRRGDHSASRTGAHPTSRARRRKPSKSRPA